MKEIRLNELEWHDADIIDIKFETRKNAFDSIKLVLSSEAFVDDYDQHRITIILQNVFKVRLDLNLWISGNDVINNVSISDNSEWVNSLKIENGNNFGPKSVRHIIITTNTNSCLEFLATEDLLIDLD